MWRPHTLALRGLLVSFFLLLSGCASLSPGHDTRSAAEQARLHAAWLNHAAQVRTVQQWQCFGRVGIRAGIRGGTITLAWRQAGNKTDIRLSAPLNQGGIELSGRPDLMRITDSEGHQKFTTDPARTIQQLTGWKIPINALPDWIRGLPHDPSAQLTWDEHGRLARLEDEGWVIDYEHYALVDHRVFLPTQITLQQADVHLKIILEQWTLPPTPPIAIGTTGATTP